MSLKLSELKKLHDKGLALIWLRSKSKRPFEEGWTKAKLKSWDEMEASFEKSYNVGVRLGAPSKLVSGNFLGAIDCDVKASSRKARKAMNDALRSLGIDLTTAPIVMSGRGNGSKHVYVQTKKPMQPGKFATSAHKVKVLMPGETRHHTKAELEKLTDAERKEGYRIRPAWEISFMGTGQQTVLPPSIHPDTGMHYAWASPLTVKQLPVFDPAQFRDEAAARRQLTHGGESTQDDIGGFQAVDVNLWKSNLPTPFIKLIEDGEGSQDRSADLLTVTLSMCRHGFTDNQILSVLSSERNWISGAAKDHTQSSHRSRWVKWLSKYTLAKARFETSILRRFDNPPERKPLAPKEAKKVKAAIVKEREEQDWRFSLQKNENGKNKPSLTNIELICSNTQGARCFVHDQFAARDSYGLNTAWGGVQGAHLSDIDLVKIRHWLSGSAFTIEPGKELTLDAVRFIADRNKFHPVRQWLSSLEWDGVKRINTWMRDYLGAETEEPYLSEVSRIFLLAMVKRVFEPGCQWDYTVVLEGNQGTFKSTTARMLAGDEWFMDNLPDLRDKDAMLNLQGKWVIELGELADVKRGDYNAVKAYLNRRVDRVRSPYGMLAADIPRQSVFIGTVNEGEYLKDPTGNRRFWPVKVKTCDVEGLRKVRDQLFAEAMWQYENCFDGKLMMGPKANAQARKAQADRRVDDDSTEMEGALQEFIEAQGKRSPSKRFDFSKFKARDLFNLFDGPWKDWEGRSYHYQIGAQVLSNMGFEKRTVRGQRIWGKKDAAPSQIIKRLKGGAD